MYLQRIKIAGVRGFHGRRSADLAFGKNADSDAFKRFPGWTVVAGRNGSGKSTFLRSIALALAGPEVANNFSDAQVDWISHGQGTAVVRAEIRRDFYEVNLGTGRPADRFVAQVSWNSEDGPRPRPQSDIPSGSVGGKMADRSLWSAKPTGWFSAGYGPFRRLAGTGGEVARLMAGDYSISRFVTLFREEASLAETVQWLQQINYRARSDRAGYAELERHVLDLMNDGLFPDGHRVDHVDPDGVWVTREGGSSPIRLDEMSDGYRTVSALVMDIVRQIHECFDGKVEWGDDSAAFPTVLTSGVVLIDEVDVHLHVSWQKQIGPWLVKHFPFIQFIVSTHSPYVCQTADEGGLVRLPGPDDDFSPHVVDDSLYKRVVNGSGDDAALTELFGLDSPYSARVELRRRRLNDLERRSIRGEASESDMSELRRILDELEPSPLSRVEDVIQGDRE